MTPQRESETVQVELTREEARAIYYACDRLLGREAQRNVVAFCSGLDKLSQALSTTKGGTGNG